MFNIFIMQCYFIYFLLFRIFQACRGDDVDKGAGHDHLFWEDLNLSSSNRKRNRMHGTDTDANPFKNCGEVNKARPTWEDMIIAYSTIPGFASIRDHDKGTWYDAIDILKLESSGINFVDVKLNGYKKASGRVWTQDTILALSKARALGLGIH